MIAEWSRVLLLTAHYLSPLPDSKLGRACDKVASDMGLGSGFCWVLQFPQLISTGLSPNSQIMAGEVLMIKIQLDKIFSFFERIR